MYIRHGLFAFHVKFSEFESHHVISSFISVAFLSFFRFFFFSFHSCHFSFCIRVCTVHFILFLFLLSIHLKYLLLVVHRCGQRGGGIQNNVGLISGKCVFILIVVIVTTIDALVNHLQSIPIHIWWLKFRISFA